MKITKQNYHSYKKKKLWNEKIYNLIKNKNFPNDLRN